MKVEFITSDQDRIEGVNNFINDWNGELDFINCMTSGSTGQPKLRTIRKSFMLESAKMTGAYLKLQENDTALHCLSMNTIAGKMMVVRAIVLNLRLIVVDVTSDPLKQVNYPVDFAAMVPIQVQSTLPKISLIQKLIIGGGIISGQLWDRISNEKLDAYQTFGMTETISHIAMRKISKEKRRYEVLPGIEIDAKNGCLIIHAPNLGVEHLLTNDHVEIDTAGSFEWLGRKDFVVNSGGIKIHPEIIESKLDAIIKLPFFVIGLPDDVLGEKLVICVEGNCDFQRDSFSSVLDKYEIPKELFAFEAFIRTESGKVNRLKTIALKSHAKKQVL